MRTALAISGQKALQLLGFGWDSPAALSGPCTMASPGEPVRVVPCVFSYENAEGATCPDFRMESPMSANCVNALKGPALLAKAGVTFSEAQWLYSQRAVGGSAARADDARLVAIRKKVSAFLQRQVQIASAELAVA
jgi:hypothetical protein